jgi:hypothetical protein
MGAAGVSSIRERPPNNESRDVVTLAIQNQRRGVVDPFALSFFSLCS